MNLRQERACARRPGVNCEQGKRVWMRMGVDANAHTHLQEQRPREVGDRV